MKVFAFRRLARAAFLASLAVLPLAASAGADEYKVGDVTIDRPWTRATTVQTGAAYMTVRIAGQAPDKLVKVTSIDAERVEIHSMSMEGGVARMREVPGIDIRPGAATQLKPGGFHLMLVGLRRPLREGESIRLALTFEKAGTVEVDATVEKAGAPGPSKRPH
jgi:copper(I)-binding protein